MTEFTAFEEPEDPPYLPEPLCADPNELVDPVKVEWSCGLAVGQPYWQNVDTYESDECPGGGTTWVEREDWEAGAHHFQCDRCGQPLEDESHYEVKP